MSGDSESGGCQSAGLEIEDSPIFNMGSLRSHLPQKRKGLSKFFSGKSRSFSCMEEAKCIDDLKKPEIREAKKRKKCSERQSSFLLPPVSCITTLSSTDCRPYVDV